MDNRASTLQGLFALSPLLMFLLLYVALGIAAHDFYAVPITVVFFVATLYSLCVVRGQSLSERLEVLYSGAGQSGLMQMVWIFILAGAFAATAKQMGAIDATVNLVLAVLPSGLVLAGLFVAACLISLSIGTSVGTIAALTPIAAGMATQTEANMAMVVAVVVGGAFFGDNLSFISDTTIVATRTQGCRLSDKFRMNIRIALPAALLAMAWYIIIGMELPSYSGGGALEFLPVLPYLFVLGTAIAGMNVMLVLALGIALAGGIGLYTGALSVSTWMEAMSNGIMGMGELIVVTLMASSMMAVIRQAGGIEFILHHVTCRIRSSRAAELTMAALVVLTNICTANNTIAILTIGPVAHDIGQECNVDPRRAASVLDTFSCFAQGLLPYGAQLLIASGLAAVSPMEIIPYLCYPFILGFVALANIILHHEK